MSHFPLARIKTIMKSSPDTELISHEAVLLVAKSAETFVEFLAKQAFKKARNNKKLDYKEVAEVAQTDNRLDFLSAMVPRKITIREFKDILKNQRDPDSESDENDSSSESESENSGDAEGSADSDATEDSGISDDKENRR